MVKNCILWLTFSLLLTVTSATACFAGKSDNEIRSTPGCSIDNNNSGEHSFQEVDQNHKTNPEKEKPEVKKESSPSILNSNFIFYIIYKYKFIGISSSDQNIKEEEDDQLSSPLNKFSSRLSDFIFSFFKDKL